MRQDTRVLRAHYRDGICCSRIDEILGLEPGTARRMVVESWVDDYARTPNASKWREYRRFNGLTYIS